MNGSRRHEQDCRRLRVRSLTSGRSGAMLLEVMVALTILATAGLAAVSLAREAIQAIEHARAAEVELMQANAFLDVVALWPREELDQRLGEREQGPWRLRIDRPLGALYVVILVDRTSTRELLRTSLYRPEPTNAGE